MGFLSEKQVSHSTQSRSPVQFDRLHPTTPLNTPGNFPQQVNAVITGCLARIQHGVFLNFIATLKSLPLAGKVFVCFYTKSQLIRKDPDAGKDWRQEEKGDDREWDGWMASLTRWTWVWASSRSWWWTRRHGMLQSMGSQRVGHNWVTEQQQRTKLKVQTWYTFNSRFST